MKAVCSVLIAGPEGGWAPELGGELASQDVEVILCRDPEEVASSRQFDIAFLDFSLPDAPWLVRESTHRDSRLRVLGEAEASSQRFRIDLSQAESRSRGMKYSDGYNVREADYVVRIGGDEFLIILPETDGEVDMAVQRLKDGMAQVFSDLDVSIGLSIGVVTWEPDGEFDLDRLLIEADTRMYEDKRRRSH